MSPYTFKKIIKNDSLQIGSCPTCISSFGIGLLFGSGIILEFFLSTDNSGVGSSHSRPQLAHSLPWLWAHGPTIIMLPFSSLGCVDRKCLGCIRQKNLGCVLSCLLLLGLLLAFLFLFFTPRIFLLLYHYFWQVTFLLGHTSTS